MNATRDHPHGRIYGLMSHLKPLLDYIVNDTAPNRNYTLSLHDALPICSYSLRRFLDVLGEKSYEVETSEVSSVVISDRKSTRLNSSHMSISYAVFCLKKKMFYANLSLA